jgi:two-component system, OmpR family, response regulator
VVPAGGAVDTRRASHVAVDHDRRAIPIDAEEVAQVGHPASLCRQTRPGRVGHCRKNSDFQVDSESEPCDDPFRPLTTATEESAVNAPLDGAGLHILIVEDHPDCAESMAMLLRVYGHEVEVAPNGTAGLDKALFRMPDVVLLDLGLPGLNGYEVARRLSAIRPGRTPLLIAVTGFGQEEDRQRSAEAGVDLHLVKPVEPVTLRAILARFQRLLADDAQIPADVAVVG